MSESKPETTRREVPIKYQSVGMPALFATHFTVSRVGPGQYAFALYEAQTPVIAGTIEQQMAQREQIREVPAVGLGRFLVSAEFLRDMVTRLADLELDFIVPMNSETEVKEEVENEPAE